MGKSTGKIVRLENAPTTWQEAAQWFLVYKQAQGLAKSTLQEFAYHVKHFFQRYPEAWPDHRLLKAAVYELMGGTDNAAYFNVRRYYLGGFFAWTHREGLIQENPFAGIKKRKAEGRVVNLDAGILQELLALPDRKTFAGLRDFSLMLLTLDCGIRPKEAFSLLPGDFDLRALEVRVRAETAKTRTARTLPIAAATAMTVRDLLAARHPAWKVNAPVFCTSEGTPLNRKSWAKRLELYSRKLGVKVTPYSLRHAFALQFLRGGGHALALQRMLGHTDLTMTRRYVSLTQQDLREQHTLASPINQLLPQRLRRRKLARAGTIPQW